MQLTCKRDNGSPTHSSDALVMHWDVAAASPSPRTAAPNTSSPEASPDVSAPSSPADVPPRAGQGRDESSKTKDFCKVRCQICECRPLRNSLPDHMQVSAIHFFMHRYDIASSGQPQLLLGTPPPAYTESRSTPHILICLRSNSPAQCRSNARRFGVTDHQ